MVNGKQISVEQFDAELRQDYGSVVLGKLIEENLIEDALEAAGLVVDPAKVEEYVQEYYDSNGGQAMASAQMAQQGQTEEDLRRGIENYAKVEMLGQKDLQPTEEDLRLYYEDNELRYNEPEMARFSRIMVLSEDEANEAYARTTEPDASFPDLAKELSVPQDQFRLAGGVLPPMRAEDIPDLPVRELLFVTLKPGEIGKPVQSGGAWHIIKLDEKIPAKTATFETARERIEEDYLREKMVPFGDVMQNLRSAARVKIEDPAFAELQRLYIGQELLDAAPSALGAGIPEPIIDELPGSDAAPVDEAPADDAPEPAGQDG